jgi:hypothetical protein
MSDRDSKTPGIVSVPGPRDPSHPDRKRIDSDVRAFLREPSTPWIVFDKDSRVDHAELLRQSHLSAGDTLKSGRSSFIAAESFAAAAHAAWVATKATSATTTPSESSEPKAEPSGLAVASDVVPEPAATMRPMSIDIEFDDDEPAAFTPTRRPRHATWLAIAGGATLLVVGSVLAIGARAPAPAASAASAPQASEPTTTSAPARTADEVPPPEPAATAAEARTAETKGAETTTTASTSSKAERAKSKFGRLVIRSQARYKNVYFDGKRMLGHGTRSFAVLCGAHTIAVTDKADAVDVDVPCDGEYIVSK